MGAANQINVMFLIKLAYDIFAKGEGDAAIIVSVGLDAALRVRPEQVAQEPRVGNVGGPHDVFDLVEVFQLGAEASMHAENLLVNKSGHRKAIEDVTEHAPESDGIPTLALIVEAVDSINLCAFMIASKKEEVLGILDLIAEKETYRLDGLLSSVDVVAKEQVVGLGRETPILEDPQQVIVLSMDVTCVAQTKSNTMLVN